MTAYRCPHCHGGFEEPVGPKPPRACPWCGTKLNQGYDPEQFKQVVSHVARNDSDDSDGILSRLFK